MSATTTRTPTAPEQPAKQKPGGTLYRGREGMWSWVLHRITGCRDLLLPPRARPRHGARAGEPRGVQRGDRHLPDAHHGASARSRSWARSSSTPSTACASSSSTSGPWATRNQTVLFYVVVALWVVTMLAFSPRHLINVFSQRGAPR